MIVLVFLLLMQCVIHHSLCNLQPLTFDILLMFFCSFHFFDHHCFNLFVIATLIAIIAFILWFSFHSFSSWWRKEWGGKRGSIATMLGYGSSLCRSMVRHRWCIRKSATGHGWCVKPTIAITLLQQSGPPSLTWQKNVFLFWVLLGLLCFSVLG